MPPAPAALAREAAEVLAEEEAEPAGGTAAFFPLLLRLVPAMAGADDTGAFLPPLLAAPAAGGGTRSYRRHCRLSSHSAGRRVPAPSNSPAADARRKDAAVAEAAPPSPLAGAAW